MRKTVRVSVGNNKAPDITAKHLSGLAELKAKAVAFLRFHTKDRDICDLDLFIQDDLAFSTDTVKVIEDKRTSIGIVTGGSLSYNSGNPTYKVQVEVIRNDS